MTHLGHWSTTVFLHLPQDCTNAFRVYQLDRIPADVFEKVQSTDSFFLEFARSAERQRIKISQVAIKLPPRTYGHSKMKFKDVAYSVVLILRLGWRMRFNRPSLIHAAPFSGRDVGGQARPE